MISCRPWLTACSLATWLGATVLAGCGGDGSVNRSSGETEPPIRSGIFKDGNVTGLTFLSGSESGVTDADGRYRCESGLPITFSVGAVQLGQMPCTTLAHPPALVASGSFFDAEALNIARLLIMLDQDADPSNGILISEGLREIAANWAPIDFGAADFEGQLPQVMADILTVDGRTVTAPPTANEAFEHMERNLACAYAGAFAGPLPSPGDPGISTAALRIYRSPGPNIDRFVFEAYRTPPALLYAKIEGVVELRSLPSLASTSSAGVPRVSGTFRDPDAVSGNWNNSTDNDSLSSGSFLVKRLGDDSGEYRFVGSFSDFTAFGVVVAALDGDVLTGEAFQINNDTDHQLTGSLEDDVITFSIDTEDGTATATLERGADGQPLRISGGWPTGEAGSFSAIGCRLN